MSRGGDYFLGIDGGQSSTTALIADATGRVLGWGTSGPCNHVSAGEAAEKFKSVVGECVGQACRQAGLSAGTIVFAAACLGFSGGPEDKEVYSRTLIRSENFKITNDAEIALSGAVGSEAGIIIIAGTGSIAFGRNGAGKTARAGGWGHIFGDEGGAFDLVRRALRASLQFEEGWGPATTLHAKLLALTGAAQAHDILHLFYTPSFPRSRVATFAPLVDDAAQSGDHVARSILEQAAAQLAHYIEGVYSNLFNPATQVPLSFIGGVFGSLLLRNDLARILQERLHCSLVAPRYSPAGGALIEALRLRDNPNLPSGLPQLQK